MGQGVAGELVTDWAPYVLSALPWAGAALYWAAQRLIADRIRDERERYLAERAEYQAAQQELLLQVARLVEAHRAADARLDRHSDRAAKISGRQFQPVVVPPHRVPRTTIRDTDPEG
jgi:hypothetical protein